MKLMAILNRDGGTFKTTDMAAYEQMAETIFRQAGHDFECVVVSGKDIVEVMEKAAERGDLDGFIAGGGDGTISAAAAIAWRNGIALGVIPAGTMNLFARSLKLPLDIRAVLETLANGRIEHVDIGSANGRPFIHQFSAGLHARMVRYRNTISYASRMGKISANIRASIGVIFNPPEFEMEFSANGVIERRQVSAISVSNNEFGRDPLLFADDLTGGHLGFYTTQPLKPAGVARLVFDIMRGRLKENYAVTAMAVQALDLHFPDAKGRTNCVIDGELLPMEPDVSLRLHPGELKVLVGDPPPAPTLIERVAAVLPASAAKP
ncbi:diacylglycerol kinase family lipid kinase [Rhizobium sp. LjRoot30]|uniref:diacylglycerol/lipid kinase family protein n=1 Tax=Rhizobium sp. LjRoot30 TaxID=3342320 RepID=UPI003ECC8BB3